jgi:hypothetical protein
MFADCFIENCECYFWEQKLLSSLVALSGGLIVWLCFSYLTEYALVVVAIISLALGVGVGCLFYVLTSESFCNAQSVFDRDYTSKVAAEL